VLLSSISSLRVHGLELKPHSIAASLAGISLRLASTILIALLKKKNSLLNGKKKQNNFGNGVLLLFKNLELSE
jgi:hypothetical protein